MAKGLPKKYIKKWGISKKAWSEFRKDQTGRKTTSRKRSGPSTARRGGTKTARKNNWYLGLIIGLLGFIFASSKDRSSIFQSWKNVLTQGWNPMDAMADTLVNTIGYDFRWGGSWRAPMGSMALLAGIGLHKFASMLGVNRMMARLPSPLRKVRI